MRARPCMSWFINVCGFMSTNPTREMGVPTSHLESKLSARDLYGFVVLIINCRRAQEFSACFVTSLASKICQMWKKKGHLLPIFQRPRQLNQIINERVSKAKVFYILMENFLSQPSISSVSRKSQFLAA